MAIRRSSWFIGALAGLAIGTMACGQDDGSGEAPPATTPPVARVPPISGGTLLIMHDGKTAVAADPERDVVWTADTDALKQTGRIALQSGDEPGRLVEDSGGKVHVALRSAGAVVTLDPRAGTVVARRPACPAPRGIDYDAATDRIHVACAGGELVTLSASGGDALRTLQLDSDLRDVMVQGDHLLVSRFRSAELLTLDAGGSIVSRVKPQTVQSGRNIPMQYVSVFSPAVAWRTRLLADGRVFMLFQRGHDTAVDFTMPTGFLDGPCADTGLVSGAMTILNTGSVEQPGPTLYSVGSAVDFALSPDGSMLTIAAPYATAYATSILTYTTASITPSDPCSSYHVDGRSASDAVAIGYNHAGSFVAQTRNPPRLLVGRTGEILLGDGDAGDMGDIGQIRFHTPSPWFACASCHPEGGDDGRVWNLKPMGLRRTQNLRGGLLATAPFHWEGDLPDIPALMQATFVRFLGGPQLSDLEVAAVGHWIDSQPTLPKAPPADPQAVARGQQLFEDAAIGCSSCHSGAHYTNNETVSVGTGGSFQVPSLLGVAQRAPYMHSGCARTLFDRFDPACGGGDHHGKTSQLTAAQTSDLVSYLQTL